MKLTSLVESPRVISEVVESENSWLSDPNLFHADTNEVIKVSRLTDTTADRLHKDPVAVIDGKEIYIPNFVKEYDAKFMGKIFKALQKLIKARGGFVAGVRRGLRVGNDAIPFGSADDKTKEKYGQASERLGIRILVTVDGKSLSDIVKFMGVEELLGPRPSERRAVGDTGEAEERPEGEVEVPEYVRMLWDTLSALEKSGTVYIERAAAPMFGGTYAAIHSKANPNRIMLFHKAIGKGFYIIPDKIAMYIYPDRPEMMPWKQAMSEFKNNPAKYLGNLVKPGGMLHKERESHPQLYNQVAEIVDSMGSEDVEHPLSKRPRHLFRFYLLGSGQFAGEYESGEGRAFSRKDREKLAHDIAAWASGGKAVEALEYLDHKLIESICDRHEYVLLSDEVSMKVIKEAAPIGLPWRDRNVASPAMISPDTLGTISQGPGILSRGPDSIAGVELIKKLARTAFEYRKMGEIERAMEYERKVTELINQAHAAGYGDDAEAAEHEAQLP